MCQKNKLGGWKRTMRRGKWVVVGGGGSGEALGVDGNMVIRFRKRKRRTCPSAGIAGKSSDDRQEGDKDCGDVVAVGREETKVGHIQTPNVTDVNCTVDQTTTHEEDGTNTVRRCPSGSRTVHLGGKHPSLRDKEEEEDLTRPVRKEKLVDSDNDPLVKKIFDLYT